MSNVVPFRRRPPTPDEADGVVAVAGDLFGVIEQLHLLAERAARTGRPHLEVERTVQNLLDAVSAVERAVDCIGEAEEPDAC